MKRRALLKSATLTTLAGAGLSRSAGAAPATTPVTAPAVQTRSRVRWRLASSFPPGLDTIYGAAEVLAERVLALTGGQFDIHVYPAGELVPFNQVLDATQKGTVECAHTASYYFTGKHPALAFDTCVPFGLTGRQQNAWLYHGGGLDFIHELLSDFNIVSFPGGNTGAQMGGWFRKEIQSTSDMSGLNMRIPGLGGQVMARLGVNAQLLAGGEIYQALERGAIDAAEWIGPYDDEKLAFYNVAQYYYYPGWWEPAASLSFYVNQDKWAGLSRDHQEAFRAAAAEADIDMTAKYDAQNPAALTRLIDRGVQVRRFSDEILQAASVAANELYEELASADAGYNKVYAAWKKARQEYNTWFGTAETAFAQFAHGSS